MNKPSSHEAILRGLLDAALAAADPQKTIKNHLPEKPHGRTIVVGAGKASAAMAAAFENGWGEPAHGLIITRYGHACPTKYLEVVEAAHPVPDDAGLAATKRVMELVETAGADDLVVCLISGGGSSLLAAVPDELDFAAKQDMGRALLKSGANITEMNCVRKHLSCVKGGKLARLAAPARVATLLISDVPGDDPATIASGPTVPDGSTRHDALAVIEKYAIPIPETVLAYLQSVKCETPKPGEIAKGNVSLIATPMMSLEAAAKAARAQGIDARILGDSIEGEARIVGSEMAALALRAADQNKNRKPVVLLSGGETTVTVKGDGRGGRNVEFLMALALGLNGRKGIHAIACDTDGVDGLEEIAGGMIDPGILGRAIDMGIDTEAMLANNDGHGFFEALDAQIITGPTLTNVNDFRAILID